jgi:hypothetical protein
MSDARFFFNQTPVHDLAALLHSYDVGEFHSPLRSTVPLLALMRDERNALRKVLSTCEVPMPTDLHFEFKVDHLSEGRGKASHTDVMGISGNVCIAI